MKSLIIGSPVTFPSPHRPSGPTKQLALAYYQTYGLSEDFTSRRGRRFNVREYRFAVRTFIPRIAMRSRSSIAGICRRTDTPEVAEIIAEAAAVNQENNWDAYRRKAGFETYVLAGLLFVLPKVGPLSLVAVKGNDGDRSGLRAQRHTLSRNSAQSAGAIHAALARRGCCRWPRT